MVPRPVLAVLMLFPITAATEAARKQGAAGCGGALAAAQPQGARRQRCSAAQRAPAPGRQPASPPACQPASPPARQPASQPASDRLVSCGALPACLACRAAGD